MPEDSKFIKAVPDNCNDCIILNVKTVMLPVTESTYFKAKIYNPETDEFHLVILDNAGKAFDEDELLDLEYDTRFETMGAINLPLWDKLAVMEDDELLQVDIWLAVKVEFPDGNKVATDADYLPQFKQNLKEKLNTKQTELLTAMQAVGVSFDDVMEGTPIIRTTLTKAQLLKIHKLKGVGRIMENQGPGIPIQPWQRSRLQPAHLRT